MQFPKPIRLPAEAYANPENTFHVVIRAHPKVGAIPFAVRSTTWDSVLEQRSGARIALLAACLMPDHIDLLLRPAALDVIAFLDRWKSWSTRLAWSAGHEGILWQPSFWDRAIRDGELETALGYVLSNPVAAGLVEDPKEWCHAWVSEQSE